MTTAERKLAFIYGVLAKGGTAYLTTALRTTKIDAAVVARFGDRPVVKVSEDGENLLLSNGKQYVIANGCKLTACVDAD